MPDPIKPGNISFDISFKKTDAPRAVDEDAPLRIAVIGNFSGNADDLPSRAIRVDVDNFDAVCPQFGAGLKLPGSGDSTIHFRTLEDFHPDQLLRRIPSLSELLELRGRIANPATVDAAAAEFRELFGSAPETPPASPSAPAPAGTESPTDLIARLLGKPAGGAAADMPTGAKSLVEQLIAKSVAPTSVPSATPAEASLLLSVDAELSRRLREVMHHAEFQSLEAAWRGLDWLVRNSGENVKLHAISISRSELDRQVSADGNPAATGIGRQLEPLRPAIVLSAFSYGKKDVASLTSLAKLAAACGTACIAGAHSDLAGCRSFGEQPNALDWTATAGEDFATLRRAGEAAHLGLAMPRVLLRQPYGPGSDAIESFPFSELPAERPHESYLWGSAAFLCGQHLLEAFANDGWAMELGGSGGEVGGLPVHSFKKDGEKETMPCAEAWLPEKAADAILARGMMPVLSVRGRDAVLLVSLRSIAEPGAAAGDPGGIVRRVLSMQRFSLAIPGHCRNVGP